jgi:hypothetical protein
MAYYVKHQLLSGRTVCVGPFATSEGANRAADARRADYARYGQTNPLAMQRAATVEVTTKRDRRALHVLESEARL